ncbi:sigma 54 modulation/S30EA ribosomal C-terminal domain-containing protein [Dactylosporangium sp. NPDC051541]|uniref:sigma 54 modulation/S30EA ribosomal C-terminal domain-containing protein n=1 Tax=Dactylosporangium sp. NPDC051541 TaxID=3363977 RepID=UPI0037AF0A92
MKLTARSLGPHERIAAEALFGALATRHRLDDDLRLRVTGAAEPGGPMVVQANLRLFGAPARIQVAGRDPAEALAVGAARLDRQVRRLSTAWEPWPWPDPERRALAVPGRPVISRVKTPQLYRRCVCQAAAHLAAMDYDAYLFIDSATGEDAVVHRAGPTGLQLTRQRSMHPADFPGVPAPTVNPRRPPVLSPSAAASRMTEGWLPFLFFTDPSTGRGNLVYRRYDGGIGLVLGGKVPAGT